MLTKEITRIQHDANRIFDELCNQEQQRATRHAQCELLTHKQAVLAYKHALLRLSQMLRAPSGSNIEREPS